MKIVTGEAMRRIDKRAISDFGIKSEELMENAGRSVADFLAGKFNDTKAAKFLVLCGKGSNGGDGLVIARLLTKKKYKVKTVMFMRKEEAAGDVKINLAKCEKERMEVIHVTLTKDFEALKPELLSYDIVVDALLGTGFRGAVSGFLSNVIEFVNSHTGRIVSVDLPSGLNASTGQVAGACVKADHTVALGLSKLGLCIYPGVEYSGEVVVTDIGLPDGAVDRDSIRTNLVEEYDASKLIPLRSPESNKGSMGKVFIAGGSPGMTGAPYMSGMAALRSGCGIVTLGVPSGVSGILENKTVELMTRALPETSSKVFSANAAGHILEFIKDYNVLVAGPGVGRDKDTGVFIKTLVAESPVPLVVDADGLTLMSSSVDTFRQAKSPVIITPHPGEMSRLMGVTVEFVQSSRVEIAQEFSKKYGIIVVLKGAKTITASPDGEVYVNSTGNSGMATAGTGDVLTGVIASFLAQGCKPLDAAILGTYVHGLAGDMAKSVKGEYGLIASDVIENIPYSIKKVMKK